MKKFSVAILILFFVNSCLAFGLKDLGHAIDKSYKCKPDDQGCKNRQHALALVKVAAVAVAVTYITKMAIEHKSKKMADEKQVATEYKNANNELPEKAMASVYTTTAQPGNVVSPGKKVVIQSDIVVVPGRAQSQTMTEPTTACS